MEDPHAFPDGGGRAAEHGALTDMGRRALRQAACIPAEAPMSLITARGGVVSHVGVLTWLGRQPPPAPQSRARHESESLPLPIKSSSSLYNQMVFVGSHTT